MVGGWIRYVVRGKGCECEDRGVNLKITLRCENLCKDVD